MRLLTTFALLAALTAASTVTAQANAGPPWKDGDGAATSFNLNVVLRAADDADGRDHSFGFVKFRQPADPAKIVFLNVRLRRLAPNHRYYLQRATDLEVNDACTGTDWLTLGQGPTPAAITTNDHGKGRAALFRDLSAIPTGTQFDINFRVVDADGSAVVLTSDCYQFTVRGP